MPSKAAKMGLVNLIADGEVKLQVINYDICGIWGRNGERWILYLLGIFPQFNHAMLSIRVEFK